MTQSGLLPVRLDPAASRDAWDASRWLEELRPGLGRAFLDEIDRIAEHVARHPGLYQRFRGECRRAVLHRFDYAMVYRVLPGRIEIVAILHCRLDPALVSERAGSASS